MKQEFYDQICELADANKFNALEKPKQIRFLLEPFSVENDMLTPTFKLKRNVAKKKYENKIESLYAEPVLKATKKK